MEQIQNIVILIYFNFIIVKFLKNIDLSVNGPFGKLGPMINLTLAKTKNIKKKSNEKDQTFINNAELFTNQISEKKLKELDENPYYSKTRIPGS